MDVAGDPLQGGDTSSNPVAAAKKDQLRASIGAIDADNGERTAGTRLRLASVIIQELHGMGRD
jgi:hypothetical protein